MIKKIVLGLFFAFFLGIMACYSCSDSNKKYLQDEYEKALKDSESKYEDLKSRYSELEESYSKLEGEYNDISAKYSALDKSFNSYLELSEEEQKAKLPEVKADKFKEYNTGITYEQLVRAPEKYNGENLTLSGEIINAVDTTTLSYAILAVDGNKDNLVWINYMSNLLDYRLLKGDKVTVYGSASGEEEYSVPRVWVKHIEVNK